DAFSQNSRRDHSYVSKVRPAEISQPDRAAARYGVVGVRASADLRKYAGVDRRGDGSGRASRSQPDRPPGTKSRRPAGHARRAKTEDYGDLRDETSAQRSRRTLPRVWREA